VEDLATSDLTRHQAEELGANAESAKQRRLFSKAQKKTTERMSVRTAPQITKTLNHRVDVDHLSVDAEKLNAKGLVNEAVEHCFKPAERI
jgi:hypothetical protein